MERDEGKKMDYITLFTDILPKEQERMRVCFHAREMTFRNGETIMEYSNSMKKIGLILYGRAILYCCDTEGNEYMIDELNKDAVLVSHFCFRRIHSIIMSVRHRRPGSCLSTTSM